MRQSLIVALLLASFTSQVLAQDWPQFGGLNRDGKSPETGLLSSWPEAGPNLLWESEGTGIGYSSMAIVGDRIFTLGDIGNDQFLIAVNRSNGQPIWKQKIGEANKTGYPGSRSTPTFSDDNLYALSTSGELFCVAAEDGSIRWNRNLKADFAGSMMQAMKKIDWQFSESPIVEGDLVVVTPGSKDAAMVGLNKTTGETVWKTSLPDSVGERGIDGAGYSSIVAADIHGTRQLIQLYGRGVMSVDAQTGEYLWGYNGIANHIANISSVVVSENKVFASTGYQTGAALIEIKKDTDKWSVDESYFLDNKTFQNHHGGFALHDGHIYGGHGHKLGLPVCIEFDSGDVIWGPIRTAGKGSASLAMADGHLYLRYEDGLVVLVKATPEGYEEKGSFMIPEVKGKSWSRPVIVDGKLYLKEQDSIYCYDIKDS